MASARDDYEVFDLGHRDRLRAAGDPGVWGHFAGGGLNDTDTKLIDEPLKELLRS